LDVPGAVLIVLSITGAVIALNRLPRGMSDGLGLAGLTAVAVLLPLAVLRLRFAAAPFIDRAVSRNGRFWALSTIGFTAQGTHFAVIVLIPLLLTSQFGASTIEVGLWMLPGALAIATFGLAGGQLLERLGARFLLIAGALVMAGGVLVFHGAGAAWQAAGISLLYACIAAGYGMLQSAVITAATGAVSEELAGMASGAFNLLFFLGGAVSVALSSAILRRREGTVEAWNPFFDGPASAYSDALLVVVVYVLAGVVLALVAAPRKATKTSGAVELPVTGG
jgi:predicted MFS family arabinose efflux permease